MTQNLLASRIEGKLIFALFFFLLLVSTTQARTLYIFDKKGGGTNITYGDNWNYVSDLNNLSYFNETKLNSTIQTLSNGTGVFVTYTDALYDLNMTNKNIIADNGSFSNSVIFPNNNIATSEYTELESIGAYGLRFTNDAGYIAFTPQNTGWAHFTTDRSRFYFNQDIYTNGGDYWAYNRNDWGAGIYNLGLGGYVRSIQIENDTALTTINYDLEVNDNIKVADTIGINIDNADDKLHMGATPYSANTEGCVLQTDTGKHWGYATCLNVSEIGTPYYRLKGVSGSNEFNIINSTTSGEVQFSKGVDVAKGMIINKNGIGGSDYDTIIKSNSYDAFKVNSQNNDIIMGGDLDSSDTGYGVVIAGGESTTSRFQIGEKTSAQLWSGTTNPYIYIGGVDNEAITSTLLIEDENLNKMFEILTGGDSGTTPTQINVYGNLDISQDLTTTGIIKGSEIHSDGYYDANGNFWGNPDSSGNFYFWSDITAYGVNVAGTLQGYDGYDVVMGSPLDMNGFTLWDVFNVDLSLGNGAVTIDQSIGDIKMLPGSLVGWGVSGSSVDGWVGASGNTLSMGTGDTSNTHLTIDSLGETTIYNKLTVDRDDSGVALEVYGGSGGNPMLKTCRDVGSDGCIELSSSAGLPQITLDDEDGEIWNFVNNDNFSIQKGRGGLNHKIFEINYITENVTINNNTHISKNLHVKGDSHFGNYENYTEINADGQITLNGSARVKKRLQIVTSSFRGSGTSASEVSYGLNGAWSFNQATINSVAEAQAVPLDLDKTEAPQFTIGWTSSATTGKVVWQLEVLYRQLGEDWSSTTPDDTIRVEASPSVNADGLVLTSFDLPILNISDAGMIFKLSRLGNDANDTTSGSSYLVGGAVDYTANKLGATI